MAENTWTCAQCGAAGFVADRAEDVAVHKNKSDKLGIVWESRGSLVVKDVKDGGAAAAFGVARYKGWTLAAVNSVDVNEVQQVNDAAVAASSVTLAFRQRRNLTCPSCHASSRKLCSACGAALSSDHCINISCPMRKPNNPDSFQQVDSCCLQ
ncbi:hypothetical protein DIPPA_30770 [Diplonema papillatum]|nr:hypothetical protein DIPPA_30770 [Diplonema papillatum]